MKKYFALLLTLAMVLSLAACGGGNDAPANNDTPANTDAPSNTDAPADAAFTTVEAGKLHMSTNGGRRHRRQAGPGAGGGRHEL